MTASANHSYVWRSLPDEDDGTAEVLPIDMMYQTRWARDMLEKGLATAYWATEFAYDYRSPVFRDGKFTEKPVWAVHIAWFNK